MLMTVLAVRIVTVTAMAMAPAAAMAMRLWTRAVVAYTRDTQDYPIGTHLWHFTGNVCSDGSVTRMMNLHRSTGAGEFSCSNGVTVQRGKPILRIVPII